MKGDKPNSIFKILDTLKKLVSTLRTVSILIGLDCWDPRLSWDAARFVKKILTLLKPFESENDEKSQRIEKSQQENAKIHALLDRKLLRNAKIFRSWLISWSWSRLFDLDIDVEMKSRSLNLDRDFLTVEMHFLTLSRFSWLSRCTHWRRFDWDTIQTPQA